MLLTKAAALYLKRGWLASRSVEKGIFETLSAGWDPESGKAFDPAAD